MSDLERELESELRRVLDPLSALPIPDRRQGPKRTAARALIGGAGAALTVKVLTGVAVAAAAVTITGAATTGSLNPADWGQLVKQQVNTCKDDLASGQHGIGDCVSSFASQHGSSRANMARATRTPKAVAIQLAAHPPPAAARTATRTGTARTSPKAIPRPRRANPQRRRPWSLNRSTPRARIHRCRSRLCRKRFPFETPSSRGAGPQGSAPTF